MALKIGDRPTVRLPTFDLPKPPAVTNKFPAFNADASTFTPAGAPPPVVLQPPQKQYGPPAFWGFDNQKLANPLKLNDQGEVKSAKYTFGQAVQKYGMPQTDDEVKAWYDNCIRPEFESKGFKCGPLISDRGHFSAVIGTREHPEGELVTLLRTDGIGGPGTKATWETHGEDIGTVPGAAGQPDSINGIFDQLIKSWSGKTGFKAGASPSERKQALEQVRDDLIRAGRAAGLDLALNTKANGELSTDAIVWKLGERSTVIDFAKASKDLNQGINLQWLDVGGPGNYTPLPGAQPV